MIKNSLLVLCAVFTFLSNSENSNAQGIHVKDITELNEAIEKANPGDEIIMANGNWEDVQIRLVGYGKEKEPITLRAETDGEVIIKGKSDLKLGGEYLVVKGLYFTDGSSPSESVIEFAINQDTLANHSRITNCVILDYNKSQRKKRN